jgi:hypothetical protein
MHIINDDTPLEDLIIAAFDEVSKTSTSVAGANISALKAHAMIMALCTQRIEIAILKLASKNE